MDLCSIAAEVVLLDPRNADGNFHYTVLNYTNGLIKKEFSFNLGLQCKILQL